MEHGALVQSNATPLSHSKQSKALRAILLDSKENGKRVKRPRTNDCLRLQQWFLPIASIDQTKPNQTIDRTCNRLQVVRKVHVISEKRF